MTENAGMYIDVNVDDEGEDTYRPIIRLHTGRNIPVQEYTSTSVGWQEELTKGFNGFLDSLPDTPSFAYTSDNYTGFVVGFILRFVAFSAVAISSNVTLALPYERPCLEQKNV